MATRYTVIEQFAQAFECSIVPQGKLQDRINAARMVIPHCTFHPDRCARGIEALRAWSFKWDDERKIFSAEPDHNWASHGADAFSYGAQMVRELVREQRPKSDIEPWEGKFYPFSLDELHEQCGGKRERRI